MTQNHQGIYQHAELYDIAFDYRNVAQETDFLLGLYQAQHQTKPARVLELAAGPARHALECARQGLHATALDLSAEMLAYASSLAQAADLPLTTLQADMREFQLDQPVDLAFTLLDSTAYLLTQADFLNHLGAVASQLQPGGLYVMEMSHPADFLTPHKRASTDWEMERGPLKVDISWGHPDDFFDPVSQITDVQVRLYAEGPDGPLELAVQAPQRCYTFQEVQALVRCQSDFKLVQTYGAFDTDFALDDERAWRMIVVLQNSAEA